MRKSTVTSLRTRVRDFETDSASVLHEADMRFVAQASEENELQFDRRKKEWVDQRSLALRCAFLEDTLKIYQAELQFHVGEEKRDRRDFERDVVREMSVLDETNRAVMRQLRQSQVEVESMQDVQEELHKRSATHYERLLARHKERSDNQKRVLENDNVALRLRVTQLEAALANWKKMEETEAATEANDATYKMSLLKEEARERNLELKRAVQHQHKLEQSLMQARDQLHLVLDFIDGCGGSAQRVELVSRRSRHEHMRLVNRLLRVAQEGSGIGGAGDGGDDDDDASAQQADADADADSRAVVAGGAATTTDRATNDVVRLQRAVDLICDLTHAQHVELALAIDSAATVWEGERHQLELRHREALSHGQTLQARIQVVERQAAAAQEDAMAERDRALQLRDQAVVFLRSRDLKEQRHPMRNAEAQTIEAERREGQ